jgi:hypothetical protein
MKSWIPTAAFGLVLVACSHKTTTSPSPDMTMTPVADLAVGNSTPRDMANATASPDMVVLASGDMTVASGDMTVMLSGPGRVPDPGNDFWLPWPDKEPNDTFDTASPAGVASERAPYFDAHSNTVGGADKIDYYAFKSTVDEKFTLSTQGGLCYADPNGIINATLYQVTADGKPGTILHEWKTVTANPPGSCLSADLNDPVQLNRDGIYLLAIRAVNVANPVGYEA